MIRIDYVMLGVLPFAVAPALLLARARPRLAFLVLIAGCLAAALLVGIALQLGGFARLRLLAWAIFAGFPAGALLLALLLRTKGRGVSGVANASAVVVLGVYVHAFHLEPTRLEVNHHRIVTERLDEPLRIALIADLQTDAVGDHERRAVEAVRAAQPDLILLAGDYLQCGSLRALERETPKLQRLFSDPPLTAPLGVHAVAGNCEWGWPWPPIFDGTPVTPYQETTEVELGPLRVTCLSFDDSRKGARLPRTDERFHVALGHYPDFALGSGVEADLLLAGHCHGGQVRLPLVGPPITLSGVPRAWTEGVTELSGGRRLLVSRGVGMERGQAPRLRFRCRPEVVIIDLVPPQPAGR